MSEQFNPTTPDQRFGGSQAQPAHPQAQPVHPQAQPAFPGQQQPPQAPQQPAGYPAAQPGVYPPAQPGMPAGFPQQQQQQVGMPPAPGAQPALPVFDPDQVDMFVRDEELLPGNYIVRIARIEQYTAKTTQISGVAVKFSVVKCEGLVAQNQLPPHLVGLPPIAVGAPASASFAATGEYARYYPKNLSQWISVLEGVTTQQLTQAQVLPGSFIGERYAGVLVRIKVEHKWKKAEAQIIQATGQVPPDAKGSIIISPIVAISEEQLHEAAFIETPPAPEQPAPQPMASPQPVAAPGAAGSPAPVQSPAAPPAAPAAAPAAAPVPPPMPPGMPQQAPMQQAPVDPNTGMPYQQQQ